MRTPFSKLAKDALSAPPPLGAVLGADPGVVLGAVLGGVLGDEPDVLPPEPAPALVPAGGAVVLVGNVPPPPVDDPPHAPSAVTASIGKSHFMFCS